MSGITQRPQRGWERRDLFFDHYAFIGEEALGENIPLRPHLLCGLCVMHVMHVRCDSESVDNALHPIGQYRITEIQKKSQTFIGYFKIG